MLPPSLELSLRDRAVNAFKSGNVPRAYGLYQAYLLSSPREDLENALQSIRWDKKRIVPRLGYSFAVGLIVNNTSKQESLKPIGTDLEDLRGTGAGGAPGSGGGRPGLSGGAPGGFGLPGSGNSSSGRVPALPAKELSDAAGKYATKFVEAFNEGHSDGKWSEAFREYEFGSSLTMPTNASGFGGFAGSAPGLGAPGAGPPGAGAPGTGGPLGYGGGQGGPPAGYAGGPGIGGPPAGYGGGQGGPPAGYGGGQGGPPAGYGGGQGGPPAGYGGGQGGPPAGYGGGQGGPPAGYGGGQGGPPAGQPGGNAPPGGNGGQERVEYIAPQDDAVSATGLGFGSNATTPPSAPGSPGLSAPGFGAPGIGAPGFGAPGFGAPGFGAPGFGAPGTVTPPAIDPSLVKDLQLPSGTIPLGSGLNYIGKGDNVGELSKRALDQHYDILIVFEVDVSFVPVNRSVKNDCRMRAIDLRADKDSKEKAITSTQLNNRDIAADKDGDGRIEKAVDAFIKRMQESYPLEDLPSFKAESINGKRLKDLVNNKVRSKLDLLCEVELYAFRGLIDNTLKVAAFDRIAGSDGKEIANSEPEDRVPLLEKMVDREFD